jgi:hypothetical protein
VGGTATIVATIVDAAHSGTPLVNYQVPLSIASGPNAGTQATLTSDAAGTLTYSYSSMNTGVDVVSLQSNVVAPAAAASRVVGARPLIIAKNPVADSASVVWNGGPDLVVQEFTPPQINWNGQTTIHLTDTTANIGNVAELPSTTQYFISTQSPVDPTTAVLLGGRSVPALAPGASNFFQSDLPIPSQFQAPGTYYLKACANGNRAVAETNYANNCQYRQLVGMFHQTPLPPPDAPSDIAHDPRLASRLVYVEQADAACNVKVFDTTTRRSTLLIRPSVCPTLLAAAHDRHSILLLTDATIQEVPLQGTGAQPPRVLPVPRVQRDNQPAKPAAAGYQADGDLAVVMEAIGQTGSAAETFLYVNHAGQWLLKDHHECNELCPGFAAFPQRPRNAYFWDGEQRVWHRKQSENPYVKETTVLPSRNSYDTTTKRVLVFGANTSELVYDTFDGDSDTLTSDVKLTVNGRPSRLLKEGQTETRLMGRFLLIVWGYSELFDLETGNSLLGKLRFGEWVY